ncbi:hypothetical protein [Brochothrix thermosphacta]|uniref:Uncharacterized protein n=1 Tax=Brochothrix thermosphacta TaxID=2756 RepID=A0A2X0QLL2_BROTH|nr:hypothetical protein [Brochothrix thermosphacta]SPP29354.1 conserved hypothetical protein [Brochothrix thermosphacta]
MNKATYFEAYKQFCVRFNYNKRSFIRYCTVSMSWTFKDVQKYLYILCKKGTLRVLKYHQKSVFLYNNSETTFKIDEGCNVNVFWRDGIEWEIEMLLGKKISIVTVVAASPISENQLFEKLKEHCLMVKDMSTVYKKDCWIKNDTYIETV